MHKTYDKGCFIVDDTRIIPVVAAFPSQSSILSLATKRKVFFVSAFFFGKMDLQSSSLTWPSPSFHGRFDFVLRAREEEGILLAI